MLIYVYEHRYFVRDIRIYIPTFSTLYVLNRIIILIFVNDCFKTLSSQRPVGGKECREPTTAIQIRILRDAEHESRRLLLHLDQ